MTSNLPEYTYLMGQRQAELEEARVPDVAWSEEDRCFLYTAEELDHLHEYEGEALAELGAEEFYGCGAAAFNASDALFLARQHMDAQYRRSHRGLSKEAIDRKYHALYSPSLRADARKSKVASKGGR